MKNTLSALSNPVNQDQLIAPGEVIELRFKDSGKFLSLRAGKLLHLLANHAGAAAAKDMEHRIAISALNFPHIHVNEFVECIRELIQTILELTYEENGEIRVESGPILSMVNRPVKLIDGRSALIFRFSHTIQKILQNSNHWASLSREAVMSFESRYALRLYEIISLRKSLKYKISETFEMEDLRRRLGVPSGKLKTWSSFRQKALDPAISEVNRLSDCDVAYDISKAGRRVDRIALAWRQREGGERAQLAAALANYSALFSPPPEAPKPKPRPFPPEGALAYAQDGHWDALAREHVKRLPGGHVPDLLLLAQTFRSWCAYQQIRLDDPSIERKFISFCGKYALPSFED